MHLRLLLALFAISSLLFVPSVRAQTELETARSDVATATERLEKYLDELDSVQQRGNELTGEYWQAQSTLELLDIRVAASQQASDELEAQRAVLVDQVRIIAVDRYVSRGETSQWEDFESPADRAAAEALADLIVGTDVAVIDELRALDAEHKRARALLDQQRSAQRQTLVDVEQTQAEVVEELGRMASLRSALDEELTVLEGALADLERVEQQRQVVEAEQERRAEERLRAETAARAAAARTRPAPPAPTAAVPPPPTTLPTTTPVPNPTPSQPLTGAAATATAVPNPQPSEPFPTATAVPNPQPGVLAPTATPIPNPQPGVLAPTATPIPNPQPSEPFPTATPIPNPQPSEPFPTATAVPNPQPTQPGAAGIVCPLSGPFTHIDDFSSPRVVGGVHRANDLISAAGTPVIAVASGIVEHRSSSVGGLSAHLRGDNGDYYFYTHLSGYENVGAGHVGAGTIIGYVGETGNAPIPHLHFEIHRGGYGNYINPYPLVRQACGT